VKDWYFYCTGRLESGRRKLKLQEVQSNRPADHDILDVLQVRVVVTKKEFSSKKFTECVADLIGRPLLPLTCGDMGIEPRDVEANFKHFFELGERWGAVVLMDEADVYLEQRTSESLQRNSLVSGMFSFCVRSISSMALPSTLFLLLIVFHDL